VAVCITALVLSRTVDTVASDIDTSLLASIESLTGRGVVIVLSHDGTRVDIPDHVPCGAIRGDLMGLPRLSEVRLGYGGKSTLAPVTEMFEWNAQTAERAIKEYRMTFPNVRFRFAPGAF
jgi:hypothetical protein